MWKPVLSGSLARAALDSAVEVAECLCNLDQTSEFSGPGDATADGSVATGSGGVALSLAYLSDAGVFPGGLSKAHELLDFSTGVMASVRLNPSLLDGFTGIGWVARSLSVAGVGQSESDELSDIDAEVLDVLAGEDWKTDYDLVSGLAGIGIYALSRLPRPSARASLSRILDHLARTSEAWNAGTTWLTRPELLTPEERKNSPSGLYNLGLAHGVPGVIGLLGQICASGVPELGAKARPLLSGAVAWLLSNKQPGVVRFLYHTGPGVPRKETRSAWCYGDPGIASALLVAARCTNEPAWEREAIDLALNAARRPPETAGVVDSGLCHGSAGLAHIFNRFYQASGLSEFSQASTFWFEKTLDMRRPGTGVAGYTAAMKIQGAALDYYRDPTFLTGAAGVAMALTAAATSTEPSWDQLLLLAPVRGPAQ